MCKCMTSTAFVRIYSHFFLLSRFAEILCPRALPIRAFCFIPVHMGACAAAHLYLCMRATLHHAMLSTMQRWHMWIRCALATSQFHWARLPLNSIANNYLDGAKTNTRKMRARDSLIEIANCHQLFDARYIRMDWHASTRLALCRVFPHRCNFLLVTTDQWHFGCDSR